MYIFDVEMFTDRNFSLFQIMFPLRVVLSTTRASLREYTSQPFDELVCRHLKLVLEVFYVSLVRPSPVFKKSRKDFA